MSRRSLWDEVASALTPLVDRYAAVFPRTSPSNAGMASTFDQLTAGLYEGTMSPSDARNLVKAIQPAPEFWATDLGQRLYGASFGKPWDAVEIDKVVAQNVLGITRQALQQRLASTGALAQGPNGGVTASSLFIVWNTRRSAT